MSNASDVEVRDLQELHDFLAGLDDRVDDWLREMVDEAIDLAGRRLVAHAPGGIKDLVGTDEPRPGDDGVLVQGEAYVTPDEDVDEQADGAGSSPADYPYYVDVGTGVYGDSGTPITSFPGGVMGPIEFGGRMIYIKSHKGQPAQRYSDAAADDVDVMLGYRLPTRVGMILR